MQPVPTPALGDRAQSEPPPLALQDLHSTEADHGDTYDLELSPTSASTEGCGPSRVVELDMTLAELLNEPHNLLDPDENENVVVSGSDLDEVELFEHGGDSGEGPIHIVCSILN